MRKLACLLLGMVCLAATSWAQSVSISGTVTDAKDGSPLSGVSVTSKQSKAGVKTDLKGSFNIVVAQKNTTLVFSYVGFLTQEVNVSGSNTINIKLEAADANLNEVVVTAAYGVTRKRDLTASIASVKGDAIKNIPTQSFEQGLSGKAAGMNVIIPNGVLNNPPVIRIRGANSITGSTFPLVVIDGLPAITGDQSTNLAANNVLGNLNPSDIEDIQVLKDAAATAIYGSRAANGVLLITTKRGKSGQTKVTYDAWVGVTKAYNLFEVLNAQQYVGYKNEAVKNLNAVVVTGVPAGNPIFFLDTINGQIVDTKWTDELYQTGFQQNHAVGISGGNASTRYYFSTGWTKQDGILQTNEFDRKQIRMNIDHKATSWLKLGGNFNFSRGKTRSPNSGSLPGTPFATAGSARLAFATAPNVSPYALDGRYNIIGIDNAAQRNSFNQIGRNKNLFNSGFVNPTLIRDLNVITSVSDQVLGNVFLEVTPLKNLVLRTQYNTSYQSVDDRTFYNALHGDGIQTTATTDDGRAFTANSFINRVNFTNTINYDVTVGSDHNIGLLAGSEEQKTTTDRISASRSGLSDNFYNEFQGNFTLNDNPPSNALTENYLLSFFGRINYNFKNKYFLSGNIRRDGYSAYAEGKKWGTFGGASAAWNVSDEGFWQNGIGKTINTFRVKGSYGYVGNISSVGNFSALSTFGSGVYGTGYPTIFFNQAGNKDLRWESSRKLDVGLELGFLRDRISIELGYYNSNIEDLIIDVPTPTSMGVPGNTIAANAAKMYNRGIEFTVNARIFSKKDFSWNANFNITTQKNRVTELAPGVPEIIGTTQLERTNITRPGYSIGSFFMVRTNGVNAETGERIFLDGQDREVLFDFSRPAASRYRYRDGTNAPAIDLSRDGKILGNALPTVYGGFSNNVAYKNFDLVVDMYYSFGNKVYFGSEAGLWDQRFWNNSTEVLTRWQNKGDVTRIPKAVFNDNISNGSATPIDVHLYEGGFVKFRTLGLGYNFSKITLAKINMSTLRVYAQVLNPFIITKYPGSDPEISVNGNSALTPGVDRNTVGQARTFTFGVNVGF
ncbi:MAG: TonB-dependent receptor [Bacteroidota bacterium]